MVPVAPLWSLGQEGREPKSDQVMEEAGRVFGKKDGEEYVNEMGI